MKRIGYIKIDRSILYHPALQKKDRSFCEIGAWLWLLLEASFLDRKFRIKNTEIHLKRGQLCCSLTYMAQAFNWHKSKVNRYLEKLIDNGTITSETPSGTPADTPNILTICQYDNYQDTPNETSTETKHNKLYINKEIKDAFEDIWSKLTYKTGNKQQAFKVFDKLKDIPEPDVLVDKWNNYCSSIDDKKFIQHFRTWLNNKGWENEPQKQEIKDDFGIMTRDPFTNLSSWQKGFRTLNDTDQDIREAYRQGKVSKEAMDKMSISVE